MLPPGNAALVAQSIWQGGDAVGGRALAESHWRGSLLGLLMVLACHGFVWWQFAQAKGNAIPPRPLKMMEVSIVVPPVVPVFAPLPRQKPSPAPKAPRPVRMPHASQPAPLSLPDEEASNVPQAAPEPVVAAPEPAVSSPRYNAAYLHNPPPSYPLSARRRGIEGTVLIGAEVGENGESLRVELRKGSGYSVLDQVALEAVKKWRFVPAKRGSQAVVAWVEVPISFKLENNN